MTFQPRQVLPSASLQSIQDAIDDLSAAIPSLASIVAMNAAIAAALVPYSTTTAMNAAISAAVNAAIADLVNTAPGTLNTLNELAVALGNDPNFATTMTTALAGKSNTGHGHAAADITSGVLAVARLGTGTPDSTKYLRGDGAWTTPATGVTDHGALTGLDDDDHSIYHNDTRGDARYYLKATVDSALAGKAATSHTHAAADIASGVIAAARLGTGTPGSGNWLRGDGSWQAIDAGVTDARLGTETSTSIVNQSTNYKASAGYVLTGIRSGDLPSTSGKDVETIYHKPVQKQIGGSWYTVSG